MRFKPMRDGVLVKPVERQKSDVLIVIDDEGVVQGDVVAVGPGKDIKGKRFPLDVKVGERIRFKNHETYPKYSEDGVDYVLIREPDIEGVVCE